MRKYGLWIKIGIIFFALVLSIFVSLKLKIAPSLQTGPNQIEILPRENVKLLFVGDTGTGAEDQLKVALAMETYCKDNFPLDGIVLLGDNFYMAGVGTTQDEQWQKKIEIPYGSECLRNLPIYPVMGNHDYRTNPTSQIEYTQINPRWKFPNRFYSVHFKNILRMVAFDSPFPDYCFLENFCAVDFLQSELKKEAPWKITFAHHPLAFASVKGYSHSGGLFGFLMRPIVCDSTDVWISGHAHFMEHRREPGCDSELFVAGGGGGDLDDFIYNQKETVFAAKKHGFLVMDVTTKEMTAKFIGIDQQVLYETKKIVNLKNL